MPTRCPLALVGLPPTDRALLETLCTQTWRYGLAYEMVSDLSRAELIIANADDAEVLRNLRAAKLNVPVLLIGANDGGTGWMRLARPIHLPTVIDALSHLDARMAGQTLRASAPPSEAENSLFASLNKYTGGQVRRPPPQSLRPAPARRQPMPPVPPAPQADPAPPPVSIKLSTKGPALSFPPARAPDRSADFAPTEAFSPSELPQFLDSTEANGFKSTLQLPPASHSALNWFGRSRSHDTTGSALMWRDDLVLPPSSASRRTPAPVSPPPPAHVEAEEDGPPSVVGDLVTEQPQDPVAPVLLVGSSHLNEGSLMRALLRLGYRVDCARDIPEMLELLDRRQHRFVLVDEASLRKQTHAVCRAVRDWREHMRIPPHVVVVSTHNRLLGRWLAKLAGCHGWLVTPLRRQDLQRYLEKHLPRGG